MKIMKLPNLAAPVMKAANGTISNDVQGSNIITCLARKAPQCISKCGTNIPCWIGCAGSAALSCIL